MGVPTAPGPTRCIQQLTSASSIVMVEPGVSGKIVTMALPLPYPAAFTVGDLDSAPVPQQARPEQVAPSHLGGASARGETEAGLELTKMGTNKGGNRHARSSTAMQTVISPGRSVVRVPTHDAANVMVVKRDADDTQQRSKSCGEEVEPMPRLPPPDTRPAHTRAVVSLDGSRCIVIIDTGADVSLVSARTLRPGLNYLP